ncbi:MAG: hypothetical protein IJU54_01095 [Alphaproteobacteria bacterium]|nr:hypothetical protein [Alphaproteobacteria bacterium]
MGGGKPISLNVTNFGQLINNGKIELQDNTAISLPSVSLNSTTDSSQWNQTISNLSDVALDNTNGIITFHAGSSINNIENDQNQYPIIQGGIVNINISDFLDLSNGIITTKESNPHLNINSSFYDVNVNLNINIDTIPCFNSADFNLTEPIFKNMKFFSDIKDDTGNTTETRHSISVIRAIQLITNESNKNIYNTEKDIISFVKINNTENILKLFYNENDISSFGYNSPLIIQQNEISIYNLLNKPADYIDEYDDEKEYTLDLFSFTVINNTIDYDKLTNSIPNNIQFVINNDYTGNKDLKLLPKSGSTALDIGQAFNKYPGIISFDTSIQILNFNNNSEETYKYIIKANDGMKIITKGNITLIFANDETLKLEQLFNNSTSKSTLKLIKQGTSKLIIKTKDFNVTKDSIIMVQQPIGINLVSNLQ